MAEQANTAAQSSGNEDLPQQIDYDFGMALERVDSWVDGAIGLLPNIVGALVVLLLFYGLGLLARRLIQKSAAHKGRNNLGDMLGGFVKWGFIVIGLLMAMTIVLPSLNPGDLLAGLGVGSVAIGFAFKDILQNWLAGLLILLRQPFEIEDNIEVKGHEGTVQRVETRATIIKNKDGDRIIIPNSDIYTTAVIIKAAPEKRRSQ